jgi:integrase
MRTWSVEELRAFLAYVRGERLYGVWVLAATTGLRPSEHSAVRWQDLDFDTPCLTVRQRLATVDGRLQLTPCDGRSQRTVYVDRRTLEALKRHHERQRAERRAARGGWHDLDLVAAREDGRWIHPHWLSQMFAKQALRAGLPRIRRVDLRYTHGLLLLQLGARPEIVAQRLGHQLRAFDHDSHPPSAQAAPVEALAARVLEPESDDDGDGAETGSCPTPCDPPVTPLTQNRPERRE